MRTIKAKTDRVPCFGGILHQLVIDEGSRKVYSGVSDDSFEFPEFREVLLFGYDGCLYDTTMRLNNRFLPYRLLIKSNMIFKEFKFFFAETMLYSSTFFNTRNFIINNWHDKKCKHFILDDFKCSKRKNVVNWEYCVGYGGKMFCFEY